jgi:hypothetical protein
MPLVEARMHAAGRAPALSQIFIFNIVKCNVLHFFVIILSKYVQASSN